MLFFLTWFPSYWWNSSARCTRGGRLTDRRPAFPPALQNAHSVPDKRRLNYTLEEEGGILVPWYSLCDSFNAFQSWDYFFFILPDGELNERSFLSFFLSSLLLTPPLFHLPSLVKSLSLQRPSVYCISFWHAEGFFPFDVMRKISDQWVWDKTQEKGSHTKHNPRAVLKRTDEHMDMFNHLPLLRYRCW